MYAGMPTRGEDPLVTFHREVVADRDDRFERPGWFTGRRNAETTIRCLITDLGHDGATNYRALRAVLDDSDRLMPSSAEPMAINPSYAAFTHELKTPCP